MSESRGKEERGKGERKEERKGRGEREGGWEVRRERERERGRERGRERNGIANEYHGRWLFLFLTHSLNLAESTWPKKTLIGVSQSYISDSPIVVSTVAGGSNTKET